MTRTFLLLASVAAVVSAAEPRVSSTYTPYRFAAEEGWKTRSSDDAAAVPLEGQSTDSRFHQRRCVGIDLAAGPGAAGQAAAPAAARTRFGARDTRFIFT